MQPIFFFNKKTFLFSVSASNSAIKLKVELGNVPIDECNNVYKSQGVTLSSKQICAGGEPKKDSCRGKWALKYQNHTLN